MTSSSASSRPPRPTTRSPISPTPSARGSADRRAPPRRWRGPPRAFAPGAFPSSTMPVEDAMLVRRLLQRGERVRMHLVLTPRDLPDIASANVVAELRGSEKPDEIVLIGGHLDSWDLGTGAIDDGAGVAMVMETMRLLHEMNLKPKRTIRAVLFMNEENGLRGGRAYFDKHKGERHTGVIETDAGAAAPTGFTTTLKGDALTALESRTGALAAVNAHRFETTPETGADTQFL